MSVKISKTLHYWQHCTTNKFYLECEGYEIIEIPSDFNDLIVGFLKGECMKTEYDRRYELHDALKKIEDLENKLRKALEKIDELSSENNESDLECCLNCGSSLPPLNGSEENDFQNLCDVCEGE